MILVDASIWIDFFRSGNYRAEMETLLRNRQLVTHSYLIAELALGSLANRRETLAELDCLPSLATISMAGVCLMIESRGLYANGIGFVDANLLASCLATPGTKIWTLDNRLGKVADALGIRADSRLLVN